MFVEQPQNVYVYYTKLINDLIYLQAAPAPYICIADTTSRARCIYG